MKYDSAEDLDRAFKGTIICVDNSPYYTLCNGTFLELHKFDTNMNLSPLPERKINAEYEFIFELPKLGFFPNSVQKGIIYVARSTHRQWTVGLNQKNTQSFLLGKGLAEELGPTKVGSEFAKMCLNEYNSFDDVIQHGGAFSPDYGFYNGTIYHKMLAIGGLKGRSTAKIKSSCLNSLIAEDLKIIGFTHVEEKNDEYP